MVQINYIQYYQTIGSIPWWGKKKSRICIPLLVILLIQNVEKSIHRQHQKFWKRMEVQTFSVSSPVVFHTSTPQWSLFLSVFVVWAVGFVCLSFCSSSSFLFHLSAKEKGKETEWGEQDSNRSCPLKIQLEQKFSVADRFKTDVSFIIMHWGGKQRKGSDRILPSAVSFVAFKENSHFSFWKNWKCVKLLQLLIHTSSLNWNWSDKQFDTKSVLIIWQ